MACSCEKHDHRGPLDESTENCVVDGCACGEAPEGYEVPNTDPEKGEVPAAGYLTKVEPEVEDDAVDSTEPTPAPESVGATTTTAGGTTVTSEPVGETVVSTASSTGDAKPAEVAAPAAEAEAPPAAAPGT